MVSTSFFAGGSVPIYVLSVYLFSNIESAFLDSMLLGAILIPVLFVQGTLSAINLGSKPHAVSIGMATFQFLKIPAGLALVFFLGLGLDGAILAVFAGPSSRHRSPAALRTSPFGGSDGLCLPERMDKAGLDAALREGTTRAERAGYHHICRDYRLGGRGRVLCSCTGSCQEGGPCRADLAGTVPQAAGRGRQGPHHGEPYVDDVLCHPTCDTGSALFQTCDVSSQPRVCRGVGWRGRCWRLACSCD